MSWAVALWSLSALLASAPGDAPPYQIDVADLASGADACPTQAELSEALESHMPGVIARGGSHEPTSTPPPSTTVLRLGFTVSPDGVARVTMTDATGALRLERELDLPKSGAAAGARDRAACATLAETVTLIVERYMRHLGYHEPPPPTPFAPSPPPPPPPPPPPSPAARPGGPGRLGLGLGARLPYSASWRVEPQLSAALRVGRLDLSALAGVSFLASEGVPMTAGQGTLALRLVPVRVAVGWTVWLGNRLALLPSVGGGLDLVRAETRGIDVTRRSSALEPVAEAGLRLLAALTHRIWIDVFAFQGLDVRPEEFSVTNGLGAEVPVFTTPRVYTRLGADFGIFLGKN